MRKPILMAVAGAALVLVGVLGGFIMSGGIPVFASQNSSNASPTPASGTNYCQLYEQTLAKQLKVSESQLESANSAALKAVIAQMAKDGKITSQQETKLLQMLQHYSSQPCSHLSQFAHWGAGGSLGSLNRILSGGRQSIGTAVAKSLGISASTLAADLQSGQAIPNIAKAHNVSLSSVNSAYLGAVKTLLAQAVSKSEITQDQSNALYSQITSSVQAGRYPLLGGPDGGFGGGHGRFGGNQTTPSAPTTGE